MAGSKARQGRGRGYWTGVVAEFEASDERQALFCARRGLSLSALRSWLYRLRRERGEGARAGERFVPLVAAEPPAPARGDGVACRVRVGGVELTFGERPPPSYVVELLRLMDR